MCVLYFDPFQPYKDDKVYSITPFQLIFLNVPPKDRWDPAYSALLALVPGSRAKGAKTSPMPFLNLTMDELEKLQEVGIVVSCRVDGDFISLLGACISSIAVI